jgi:DNA-binding transcriptional MerR regulator
MRVEELAERAEVSVDTVRYYQAKALLPPPRRAGRVAWYDDTHLARIGRIRALQAKGFTLAAVRRVLSGELDAADEALVGALAQDVLDDRRPLLSLDELATRTGVPAPLLQALQSEGLLIPRRAGDSEGYTEDDIATTRAGLTILEWGVPLPALLELARRHHRATLEVARHAVSLFDAHVRAPRRLPDGRDGEDGGHTATLVKAFQALLPATTTLVSHHFTRVLLTAAVEHIEQVGTAQGLRSVSAEVRP